MPWLVEDVGDAPPCEVVVIERKWYGSHRVARVQRVGSPLTRVVREEQLFAGERAAWLAHAAHLETRAGQLKDAATKMLLTAAQHERQVEEIRACQQATGTATGTTAVVASVG